MACEKRVLGLKFQGALFKKNEVRFPSLRALGMWLLSKAPMYSEKSCFVLLFMPLVFHDGTAQC